MGVSPAMRSLPILRGWRLPLLLAAAGVALSLIAMRDAAAQDISTPSAVLVGPLMCPCPGRPVPLGSAGSCEAACYGMSGGGPSPQQQMQNQIMRQLTQMGVQMFLNALLNDDGDDDAAAAAQAEARAQSLAAAEAKRTDAIRTQLLGEMQGDVTSGSSQLPLMGTTQPAATNPSVADQLMHNDSQGQSGSQVAVNLDATPKLLGGDTETGSLPSDPATIGPSLDASMPPDVPDVTVSDYMSRAGKFLADSARDRVTNDVSHAALSGELFGEAEMGPYGMATVVMINVARLPDYIFPKILAAARGDMSADEGSDLTIQAVNRVYAFDPAVNKAVAEGILQSVQDKAQDAAKEGVATLATSFLPIEEESKQAIAQSAPQVADALKTVASFWTDTPDAGN